jgi:hypothetical protein
LQQVAAGMVAVGDLAGALRGIDDMPVGGRHESLAEVAVAQKRARDEETACATFRRALVDARSSREHRPRPGVDTPKFLGHEEADDDRWDAQTAREVAKTRALTGDFNAARGKADLIPDQVWRAFALSDVARAQAATGDAEGALEWSKRLQLPRSDPSPLMSIILGIADFVEAGTGRSH